MSTHYETLGVAKDASKDDIKKAYRKLALQWHPDKHPAHAKAEAEEKFKAIAEAFEVLSVTEKRQAYDNEGADYSAGGTEEWDDAAQYQRSNSSHRAGFSRHPFSRSHADDIFAAFFGGQDPFAAMNAQMFGMSMASPFGGMGGMGMGMGMASPFGMLAGMGMGSPFGGGMAMGMGSPFGMLAGGAGGYGGSHQRSQTDPFGGMMAFGGGGGGFGMSSSMSTSSYMDGSGRTVTKTTRTTTENGQSRTTTSTQIQHPDGRVETITDGDEPRQQALPRGSGGGHARSLTSSAGAAPRSSPIDLRSSSSPIDLVSPVHEEHDDDVEELQAPPPPRRAPRARPSGNGSSNNNGSGSPHSAGRHAHSQSQSLSQNSRVQQPAAPPSYHRSESSDAAYSAAPPQPQPHQRASSQPSYQYQARSSPQASASRTSPRVSGYSKAANSPGSGSGGGGGGYNNSSYGGYSSFPSTSSFEPSLLSRAGVPPSISSVPRGVSGDLAARRADANWDEMAGEHKRDLRRTKL